MLAVERKDEMLYRLDVRVRQSDKNRSIFESAGIVQALEIFYRASIANQES